jgi:alcohol dehydrogenase (cytochrome c)
MRPASEQGGWVIALDAAPGSKVWSDQMSMPIVAGVTPTAGGVFFTGTSNGDFLVLDKRDGRVLYRFATGAAIAGGVSTYLVGDRQYIAVASGNRSAVPFGIPGSPTLVIFALPPQVAQDRN